MSANRSGILKWWIDGVLDIHPKMRGHTGGGISMRRGFPIVGLSNQKFNTRRSTYTEFIAVGILFLTRYVIYIGWALKDMMFLIILSFKTIKVLFFWKMMAKIQAESARST